MAYGELAYAEVASTVACTATSAATATTIVTAPAVTCDGVNPIYIQFSFGGFINDTANDTINSINFFEDGSNINRPWDVYTISVGNVSMGNTISLRKIPAAGSRTYSVRGWVNFASTFSPGGGAGGAGVLMPMFIRIEGDQ